jgi:DNA helicase-2/ATP-dependent DNA helicase PcrA
MVRSVLQGGDYTSYLYERYEDAERRLEELDQLALFALGFEGPEAFLTELALTTNVEAERVVAGGTDEQSLVLTTVHQAKGLEWRAVFVIGLTDGRFPSARSLRELGGEEEERRLFYVAVTRCKDELYLAYPLVGRDEARRQVLSLPSRFLEGMDGDNLLERWQVEEERVVYDDEDSQEPLLWDDDYPQ